MEAAAAQKKLHDKLLTISCSEEAARLGGLEHGTTIQTYQMPNNGSVTLRVMCNKWYYCLICPVGQKLAADNGASACGLSMCNAIDHLASKGHWTHWRKAAFDLPYDEAAWTQFTLNNKHGPSRALKTQQHAQRIGKASIKREQQRTSGNPTSPPGMRTVLTPTRCGAGQIDENVSTTVAEYLVAGVLRSEEGFNSFHASAAHHVDVSIVAAAHGEPCMNVGAV